MLLWDAGHRVELDSGESRNSRLPCARPPTQPGASQALAQPRAPRL